MEILLLSLIGLFAAWGFSGDDDADVDAAAVDPIDPVDPEEPDPLDLGALVAQTDDGLDITLGDDETGSLVAIKFDDRSLADETPNGAYVDDYALGIYLIPAGAEVVVDPTGAAFEGMTAEEYFDSIGATLVANVDLGSVQTSLTNLEFDEQVVVDNREEAPEIDTDDPLPIIRMSTSEGAIYRTEFDETLSPFEEPSVFIGSTELQTVTGDYTGTGAVDFVSTSTTGDPILVQGYGGNDSLSVTDGMSTLLGGAGNDVLRSDGGLVRGGEGDDAVFMQGPGQGFGGEGDDNLYADGAVALFGGAGDDTLGGYAGDGPVRMSGGDGDDILSSANANAVALGGDGDDRISVSGANAVAYGGDGEDTIWAYRENAVAWGGDGDDVLNLQNGSSGHGGAGNDLINLDTGSHGDGGDGDDMLRYVRPFYDSSDATVMHGGAGADVFDVVLNNATGGGTAQVVRITDFDPDEDVLQVGIGATPGVRLAEVRIETADDDSHTDVLVDFLGGYGGPGVTTAIIRLDGNVPITADQVVIGP